MAWTEADATTLRVAIASGAMRVKYADGREVTYQTTKDMLLALEAVEGALIDAQSPPSRMNRVVHVRV